MTTKYHSHLFIYLFILFFIYYWLQQDISVDTIKSSYVQINTCANVNNLK